MAYEPGAVSVKAQPRSRAAEDAVGIFAAAVEAVAAGPLVASALQIDGNALRIGSQLLPLARVGRILAVGAGKASAAMAASLETALGDRLDAGIVVTKYGHSVATSRVRILEAGHPVPDSASIEAGRAIFELAESTGENDLLICLLSGGASALMELPVDGVCLEDLRATTEALLRSGAAIGEVNTVRACLSRLKAGGLARAAAPARVMCLVISDVLGNPLEVIGSGPCVDRQVDPAAALAVLRARGIAASVPAAVLRVIERSCAPEPAGARTSVGARSPTSASPHPPTPYPGAVEEGAVDEDKRGGVSHLILADIRTALKAARGEAVRRGLNPIVLTGWMQGEAREVGGFLGGVAKDMPWSAGESGVNCLLAGGETTVTVRGEGKGGRSQELALAAARQLAGTGGVALLAAGTDGTDGPTDVAGALIDGGTVARAETAGFPVEQALGENASYPALAAAGAHVVTGATQTNVNDIVVITYRSPR